MRRQERPSVRTVLETLDFESYFILQTDASDRALGAVLSQEINGISRPVAYVSRKLDPQERRYAMVERDCLAIKCGVDYFWYYLLGHEFTLITDHAPLRWLKNKQTDNARITRWALTLQPFHFNIVYKPGKTNTVANFFSRCHEEEELVE